MIRGEIKYIWDTIDINKNSKVSEEEFEDFHEIFITPYEACDSDNNYSLDTNGLGKCLETGMLDHLDLKKENTTQLFEILDKKGLNETNFADYMFLRRVNIGWDKCAGGSDLAKTNIPCALKVVVPGWIAS